ncbi:uncharacterized protein BP01DRAFT_368000 [Aspergillus saccharolyticus JOP 1030-1]|uniref:Uncharacterized protein n=1 Tax=Aspergillus saccharolyticus JOP 1030-1 TaxID=1450539 RepID=A0A318ZG51_9EURO|nr:hypothetical protein BP01DRAFT_368000 [Aspergillus saccharolyticus JOP 1030-1]PYH42600.1 hypothetical protein BP01DRAFT_368000 [Aspergillus saccharolyticus JOP 1030-1]
MDRPIQPLVLRRPRRGAVYATSGSEAAAAAGSTAPATPAIPPTQTALLKPRTFSSVDKPAQPSQGTFDSPDLHGAPYIPPSEDAAGVPDADYHPFSVHDPLYYHPHYRKVVTWSQPTATIILPHEPLPLPDFTQEPRTPTPADADLMPPPPRPGHCHPQPTSILKPPTRMDNVALQNNLWSMIKRADWELSACHDILESTSQQCLQDLIEIDQSLIYIESVMQENERQSDMARRYGRRHKRSSHCQSHGDVHVYADPYGRSRGPRGSQTWSRNEPASASYRDSGTRDYQGSHSSLNSSVVSGRVEKNRRKLGSIAGIAASIKLEYEDLQIKINNIHRRNIKASENEIGSGEEDEERDIREEEDDDDDADYCDEEYEEEV